MSLIQEALKRQAEEESHGSPAGPDVPPVPPPAPPEPSAPAPARRRTPWGLLLAVLGLLLLLAAGAAGLLWHVYRQWNREVRESVTVLVAADPTEESIPALEPVAEPPETIEDEQPAMPKLPEPLDSPAAAPSPPTPELEAFPEPPPALEIEPAPPEPPPSPPPPEPPPAPIPAVSPPVRTVSWPALTLDGVVYVGRADAGSARINRRILTVGEEIDGARLRSIAPRGVELEYQGEIRFIQVGKTIP